jgi:hypothetical protein
VAMIHLTISMVAFPPARSFDCGSILIPETLELLDPDQSPPLRRHRL